MAQTTRLIHSGERVVGAFDEGKSGSKSISSRSRPSIAARGSDPLDDPLPLFLSGRAEQPEQESPGDVRNRASISSLIFKTSLLGAAASVIAFAFLSVDIPLPVFANAKASLIGVSADQSSPGQPAPAIEVPPDASASPQAATDTPTREEITAAFKVAHQGQPEIHPPAAAPPARRLDADELAGLLKRAKGLLAIGDIAPARLLLERAADAQEAGAALLLGQTYDPAVLGRPDARSITPDPATALGWYQKAAQLGSKEAQQRLDRMQK